ncbi:MAG: hypothetical protein ACI8P9_003354 [Parasphingorhabdus sp.]|jgi:hypothetical protein
MKYNDIPTTTKIENRIPQIVLAGLLILAVSGCSLLPAKAKQVLFSKGHAPLSYSCANDLEIQCDSKGCAAEDEAFTPMSVTFDNGGSLSVCAYSGCYEGKAKVWQKANFLSLHGEGLAFSTAGNEADEGTDIAITIDLEDSIAMLKLGAFTHPLICKPASNNK